MIILMSIIAVLLFGAAIGLLFCKQVLAPVAAFMGLMVCWLSGILPVTAPMIVSWVCMSLVVMGATYMQPIGIQQQTRGMGYITIGGLAGMMSGMAIFSFRVLPGVVNGTMIVGTVAGIFIGYLLFTRTPRGYDVSLQSGNFFRYLLAKGFPAAIAIMQIGVAIVLLITRNEYA